MDKFNDVYPKTHYNKSSAKKWQLKIPWKQEREREGERGETWTWNYNYLKMKSEKKQSMDKKKKRVWTIGNHPVTNID
jgi:hypothetical protein